MNNNLQKIIDILTTTPVFRNVPILVTDENGVTKRVVNDGNKTVETPVFHEIAEKKSYTPKLDLAVDYLRAHPEAMQESNRKIAAILGLSHPWIGKAKEIITNNG